MAGFHSPQAIWGRALRHLRQAAGLTQPQLAETINFSISLISGVETGQLPATPEFAKACDKALDTGGILLLLLDWRKGEVIPSWFDWPKYEAEARILRGYEQTIVAGLLQTREYAWALLQNEAAVQVRLARQAILNGEKPQSPVYICLLHELVLHNQIGSSEIMRGQLQHLVASANDRIKVHIVPNGAEVPWVSGTFVLATIDSGREIAYVETPIRGMTLGGPEELRQLEELFEQVRSQALPMGMSLDLINKVVTERWT